MGFRYGTRLLDMLRPRMRAVGLRSYLKASWKRRHAKTFDYPSVACLLRNKRKIGGWLPGRWRLDGLRPRRRVVNPAPRYMPRIRQYNEIVMRRRKQGAFPPPFLWAKRHRRKSAKLPDGQPE